MQHTMPLRCHACAHSRSHPRCHRLPAPAPARACCCQPTCLLLQLSRLGLDDTTRRILEHKNIIKVVAETEAGQLPPAARPGKHGSAVTLSAAAPLQVGIGMANDLATLERDFDVIGQLHFQVRSRWVGSWALAGGRIVHASADL